MDNEIEILRLKRSNKLDEKIIYVVRVGSFLGKPYLDIREYLIGPEPYQGFTKRGLRIPITIAGILINETHQRLTHRFDFLSNQYLHSH